MNKLVKVLSGSNLYGTEHKDSDLDLRGIFIPTFKECYTQTVKDAIEIKEGNDETWFSIQKFLDMAVTGQPVAIETLFAPSDKFWIFGPRSQNNWEFIQRRRKEFLTKKMTAFLKFAKSLSSKYCVKAERVNMLDELIKLISTAYIAHYKAPHANIIDIWHHLPLNEFCAKETDSEGRSFYVVLSRKYRDNTSLKNFLSALEDIRKDYGERVRAAQAGEFDKKSVSHSFRICYQLNQIALNGDLVFPLPEADFLRRLKLGELDYQREDIFNRLNDEMTKTEELLSKSPLPEVVHPELREEILGFIYQNP